MMRLDTILNRTQDHTSDLPVPPEGTSQKQRSEVSRKAVTRYVFTTVKNAEREKEAFPYSPQFPGFRERSEK